MEKKTVLILVLAILLLCFQVSRLNHAEVRGSNSLPVHNVNTGLNYTTIQAAIDAPETTDGHTVFVEEGLYRENVVCSKNVTLTGQSMDTTIVDGNGAGVVFQLWNSSSIMNFTIRNGEYGVKVSGGYGMLPKFTGSDIVRNRVIDNLYGGILLHTSANNTVSDNFVANNTLFGIHLWSSVNNTIVNNTVTDNENGINFYGASNDNLLRYNNMTGNKYNFGLILRGETFNWLNGYLSRPGIVNDVDASNTVDGKPIYCLVDRSNEQVPADAGYVWLSNCTNITISGCEFSNNLQGVLLILTNNTTISDNIFSSNVYGIYASGARVGNVDLFSNHNTLVRNDLEDNFIGIYLDVLSRFTTMRNNSISNCRMNFGINPSPPRSRDASDLLNDIDDSNTIGNKPIIYWIGQSDREVPTNAGYVLLVNSTNIRMNNLNLKNNVQNIFLLASNNTLIANCSINDSLYGVIVDYLTVFNESSYNRFDSFNTTFTGNTLSDNGVGVRVSSDNSTISNNILYRNPLGIYLSGTSYSIVSKNLIVASDKSWEIRPGPEVLIFNYSFWRWEFSKELAMLNIGGIIFRGSSNIFFGNTVRACFAGISIDQQVENGGNIFFNNNFLDSTQYQAYDAWGDYWNSSYPTGGNYWSNSIGTDRRSGPSQKETGSDGIADTEFQASLPVVVDKYPLMSPVSFFEARTSDGTGFDISLSSNSTISDFRVNATKKTMSFNVTGPTGHGYCRTTIPNSVVQGFWQGKLTILLNGVPVEFRNWTDGRITCVYFEYQHSTKIVIIVPEFSLSIYLALLMTTSILASFLKKKRSVSSKLQKTTRHTGKKQNRLPNSSPHILNKKQVHSTCSPCCLSFVR